MKDVGHAMGGVANSGGDRTAHFRGSERLVERARGGSLVAQDPIVHTCEYVANLSSLGLYGQ
jgi:hypothetical protein